MKDSAGNVIKRKKALSVSPLKTSQTMGACLAFLGVQGAIPIMHGSQGCTAFAKVFFVRHFREPVPLSSTAMDQVSSVMGADDNIVDAMKLLCDKNAPALLGVATTGLAETQGADLNIAIHRFREKHPEHAVTRAVLVNTPDFAGSFEIGFAKAVHGILETIVPKDTATPGAKAKQVTVLCSANLTPGDLEYVEDTLIDFGLAPLLIPNLSGSLDGHLGDQAFNPLTDGGVSVGQIATAGDSIATLVIGESLHNTGDWFGKFVSKDDAPMPVHKFGLLMGLEGVDAWLATLSQISGQPVPNKYRRHRKQLQDAMLDTHFMLGMVRVAVAGDGDLVLGFSRLLKGMGGDIVAAVVPCPSPAVTAMTEQLPDVTPIIGDLEELEKGCRDHRAQILIANSHGVESAERLGIPILRAGFPQYDLIGGFQRTWVGYKGTQQALFDLANLFLQQHEDVQPYHSVYSQKKDEELRQAGNSAFKGSTPMAQSG